MATDLSIPIVIRRADHTVSIVPIPAMLGTGIIALRPSIPAASAT